MCVCLYGVCLCSMWWRVVWVYNTHSLLNTTHSPMFFTTTTTHYRQPLLSPTPHNLTQHTQPTVNSDTHNSQTHTRRLLCCYSAYSRASYSASDLPVHRLSGYSHTNVAEMDTKSCCDGVRTTTLVAEAH